jgi:PAS domain S-box-containing protein
MKTRLPEARLRTEQRRIADELDRGVAERTAELAAAHEELRRERAERRRAEDALRASELEFRLIVDNFPAQLSLLTPTGGVELINRRILDYSGKTLEEQTNWRTGDMVHPEDLPHAIESFTKAIDAGEPWDIDHRLRRFDGVYRWFRSIGRPLRDADGRIVRWCVAIVDMDDRKRREEGLRESELSLRQLTETIPEMLWSATPNGMIDYCNARLLDYTGFPVAEVMGTGWSKLLHPDDVDRTERAWQNCIATGAPYRVEVRTFHTADRTFRWCVINALPLLNQEGRIAKWHGTVVDMHDWKEAQEQLRSTQAALAHVSRAMTMGELTASIAHEVNQPLAGIITNASTCLRMLAADPPNIEGARETARRTIRDGNRASDMIIRLRALFSQQEFTPEPVDLNEAAREVIALFSSEMHRNRVVVRPELADDLPPVLGDRIQLQQVVLNLLRNASDAMSEVHDRPRHLVIRTELEEGGRVRLAVKDVGVGIEPESAPRLFESFYTTKPNGMGIGLSVCRSIIESHRGRLWAEANEGPGATFSFSLPRGSEWSAETPAPAAPQRTAPGDPRQPMKTS